MDAAPIHFVVHHLFTPSGSADLAEFYFAWVCIFLFINIVWDVGTDRTEKFQILKLREKTEVLHTAASFSSSLLLIIAVFDPVLWDLAKETYIPVLIAGASGILNTIPSLCPYDLKSIAGVAINGAE